MSAYLCVLPWLALGCFFAKNWQRKNYGEGTSVVEEVPVATVGLSEEELKMKVNFHPALAVGECVLLIPATQVFVAPVCTTTVATGSRAPLPATFFPSVCCFHPLLLGLVSLMVVLCPLQCPRGAGTTGADPAASR